MSLSASNIRPTYSPDPITTAPPRFGAGTGFAGASGGRDSPSLSSQATLVNREIDGVSTGRPSLSRTDSGPPGLDSGPAARTYGGSRPTDYPNGAGSVRGPQASRPAPARPAGSGSQKPQGPKHPASSAALAERARQQQERQTRSDDETRPGQRTPRAERDERPLDSAGQPRDDLGAKQQQTTANSAAQQRERDERARQREVDKARERELRERVERDLEQREREKALREQQQRPPMQTPAKSMTANTTPATDPAPGPAGALAGPPPVKPLQTAKKLPPVDGGVAAAAAALEKPKTVEKRISTMSEAQIMDKLRSVVSPDDPKTLYSTIKKVGQGCVKFFRVCVLVADTFCVRSASGHVYVAKTLATGKKVAIKQMDLSHQPRKELIVNEILVMKESQHPNIVNFLDSYLVKGNELWVVMEYMEGGALTDVIENNQLEEDQISSICLEVSTVGIGEECFDGKWLADLQRSRTPSFTEHYSP